MIDQDPIRRRPPVDLKRQEAKVQADMIKAQAKVDEIQLLVGADSLGSIIGPHIFDTPTKQVTLLDGTVEEQPWTTADIMEHWRQLSEQGERSSRQTVLDELQFGLGAQWMHLRRTPRAEASGQVVNFVSAVMQRIMASDHPITDPYLPPWSVTETNYEAEFAEVIRRVITRSSYEIVGGLRENPIRSLPTYNENPFWDHAMDEHRSIKEEMAAEGIDLRNTDEFQRRQNQRAADRLEGYSDQDWEDILTLEQRFGLEYVQRCAARGIVRFQEVVAFVDAASVEGKRVATDEQFKKFLDEATRRKGLVEELQQMTDFNQLLEWIKKNFGEEADYQTLLQYFNSMELSEDSQTFRKKHFVG